MERQTFFWLLLAFIIFIFIVGPVRQLRSGVIEFRRLSYPKGKRMLRRDDPAKFYLRVGLEIFFLLFMLGLAYWIIFHSDARP